MFLLLVQLFLKLYPIVIVLLMMSNYARIITTQIERILLNIKIENIVKINMSMFF